MEMMMFLIGINRCSSIRNLPWKYVITNHRRCFGVRTNTPICNMMSTLQPTARSVVTTRHLWLFLGSTPTCPITTTTKTAPTTSSSDGGGRFGHDRLAFQHGLFVRHSRSGDANMWTNKKPVSSRTFSFPNLLDNYWIRPQGMQKKLLTTTTTTTTSRTATEKTTLPADYAEKSENQGWSQLPHRSQQRWNSVPHNKLLIHWKYVFR